MKKRIFAALLVATMCVTAAGCAGKNKKTSGESGELTYWVAMPSQLSASGMTFNELPMYIEYNKRTGIDVEFIHPPIGQENEKFNLMIASGNLYDIVEHSWTQYSGGITKAVNDGVVIPIDDVMEKSAPNYSKLLEENEALRGPATTRDGKFFGFPRIKLEEGGVNTSGGLFLRQDWLDKVGMEVPTNTDEWTKVLRAFKNELGIERPLTFSATQFLDGSGHFNSQYHVGLGYYVENGKVCYGPAEKAYKDLVDTFAKWYKEGLLDSEFAVVTKDAMHSQIREGVSGAFWAYTGNGVGAILAAVDQSNGFSLVGAPYPYTDANDTTCYIGSGLKTVLEPYACITKKCDNIEDAVKWLDYSYGKEGSLLYFLGIEGETYTIEDGVPTYTDIITNNPEGLSSFEARARYVRGYSSNVGASFDYGTEEQRAIAYEESLRAQYPYQTQIDAIKLFNKNAENRAATVLPVLEYSADVNDEVSNIKFEVQTYTAENVTRFILGDRPMSEWEDFVKELKSLKLDTLLKHMQTAYEEYSNK